MSESLIRKAFKFAKKKHDSTKKLYNGESFIFHPILTYQILCQVVAGDENLLCSGLTHDLYEDTSTTFEELKSVLNEDIASLTLEVTKDEFGNFPNLKTVRGLILKQADILANSSNLNELPLDKKERLFKKYSYTIIHRGDILKISL